MKRIFFNLTFLLAVCEIGTYCMAIAYSRLMAIPLLIFMFFLIFMKCKKKNIKSLSAKPTVDEVEGLFQGDEPGETFTFENENFRVHGMPKGTMRMLRSLEGHGTVVFDQHYIAFTPHEHSVLKSLPNEAGIYFLNEAINIHGGANPTIQFIYFSVIEALDRAYKAKSIQ